MKYIIIAVLFLSSFSLNAQSFFNDSYSSFKDDEAVLSIYPNPTTDYFKVTGKNIGKVSLYNIIGREVKSFEYRQQSSFDVSNLRNGVYIVRLMDKKGNMLKTLKLSIR